MRLAREWNLNWPLRLAVACCAAGYLLFARPWSEPSQSTALGAYTCSAALLILALIPKTHATVDCRLRSVGSASIGRYHCQCRSFITVAGGFECPLPKADIGD